MEASVDEEEMDRAQTLRRVRSLLLLAAQKGRAKHDTFREREKKETEFFKKMYIACDKNSDGCLDFQEVMGMARRHLKIAERLVSDKQIHDFFNAIDADGGGQIEFTEFLSFLREKDHNSKVNDIILTQVKRVVRLAMQRKKMTIGELEHRFAHAKEEGIIDGGADHTNLGPEEMRRFFRKVLEVTAHEAPDKNLAIAFKAMDEDGGGTLDAEEFMHFLKQAINERTTLSPQFENEGKVVPSLLGGMRGALPARLPRSRPGTTFGGGSSQLPFCLTGRELDARTRQTLDMPTALRQKPRRTGYRATEALVANLPVHYPSNHSFEIASFSQKGGGGPGSQKGNDFGGRRSSSVPIFSSTAPSLMGLQQDPSPQAGHGEGGSSALPPVSQKKQENAASATGRGFYSSVKGMLSQRDANMLNRIESRLFEAGVDVRGLYHKHG
mmetsp:Transcript_74142/g.162285  ORF Transcript_74142/g.162285 Transcript_74142/m.162285 type:complete len:440 (+) Transcript_74142:283-1602(+)